MSDPAAEPGAPAQPAPDHKPLSKDVAALRDHLPRQLTTATSQADHLILRLNKLFSSPGGLNSFLSTFNYTLYLVVYLQTKTPPLSQLPQILLKLLNYRRASAPAKAAPVTAAAAPAAPSGIQALAVLLSGTRTTLRLFGLFPMYVWLRTLLKGPKPDQDRVLYTISLAQCISYMTFQAMENIALLMDRDVLPKTLGAQFNKGVAFPTPKIFLWSYRAWLCGVVCDFPRLLREAALEREKRANRTSAQKAASEEEDRKVDEKWWSELVVPCAWLPVALHFSRQSGLPGMNLGIMGACGALAGLGRTAGLWAATADV